MSRTLVCTTLPVESSAKYHDLRVRSTREQELVILPFCQFKTGISDIPNPEVRLRTIERKFRVLEPRKTKTGKTKTLR